MNKEFIVQKSRRQIIEEVVEYYGADPENRRAVDEDGICMYRTDDGRACAFGRYILDSKYRDSMEGTSTFMLGGELDDYLTPEVRGHPIEFWDGLQGLHDDDKFWDLVYGGLTEDGQERYDELMDLWASTDRVR